MHWEKYSRKRFYAGRFRRALSNDVPEHEFFLLYSFPKLFIDSRVRVILKYRVPRVLKAEMTEALRVSGVLKSEVIEFSRVSGVLKADMTVLASSKGIKT